MITNEEIARINELAHKKKAEGLTPEEIKEQRALREKFLENFRAGFKQQRAALGLNLALRRGRGQLEGEVAIADLSGARTLAGAVKATGIDLSQFSSLGGGFNELSGEAGLDLKVSGNLEHPLLNGTLLVQGSAEPHFDIGRIDDFRVELAMQGSRARILPSSRVRLNEGELRLGGELDWSSEAAGRVTVDASELPVALLGYGVLYADIHTVATLGEALAITGNIAVPRAYINVKELGGGGPSASSDVIVVDEGGSQQLIKEARSKSPALKSSLDIDVSLGDQIEINAMGLHASLLGKLKVQKDLSEDDVRGQGRVWLDEHSYAYVSGHNFLFNRAETRFNGALLSPQLDIEVVADPAGLEDDVVAGVRVSGAATDPSIELFSKPAMSQNEILS